MGEHSGESQSRNDPGGDVDPDDAVHRAEERKDEPDGHHTQTAGAQQRQDHGADRVACAAAGPGKGLGRGVEDIERGHHAHEMDDHG